jgi:toxin CcdB
MAQFDVYRNPRRGAYPLLLDIQSDLLSALATRVVVPMSPLRRYGSKPITRLNPTARFGRAEYILLFQELASVPVAALGACIESLSRRRAELVAAIDLLFTGA